MMKPQSTFALFCLLSNIVGILCAISKYPPFDWKNPSVSNDPQTHSWDFDFEDHGWTESDLCKNLQCKPHQMCLVEDDDVAICVNKRKFQSKKIAKQAAFSIPKNPDNSDEEEELTWEKTEENEKAVDKDESPCIPCPVVKPDFVCGSDNHTYSSVCRLEFRNCMHKVSVNVVCKGFCPCKAVKTQLDHEKESQMKDRWNRYMTKYQNTVNKPVAVHKQMKKPIPQLSPRKNDKVVQPVVIRSNSAVAKDTFHNAAKNSVLRDDKTVTPVPEKGCTQTELKAMGDRLLDWFSVVMADHRRGQSRRRSFRLSHTELPDCKPEVSWMFQHLDTDGDLKLSLQELYDLENDDREYCLRPYLLDCDIEHDLSLSPYEWCSCFDKSQRPCAAALKRIPQGLVGGYTPLCDGDGYYLPTQCHSGSGSCWCVDRHGVEFTNTRQRGRPDCEGLLRKGQYHHESSSRDEDQEDTSSEEQEGSADHPLVF